MPKITARWVLPVDAPPIDNGIVEVENGEIVAIRSGNSDADVDYGNAVLMPGFVNAHTHIEYTALRGFLEDVPFFTWIRALTATKSRLSPADWTASAKLGALECIMSGVTAIGDNADATNDNVGASLTAATEAGLRGVVFQEVFGIDERFTVAETMASLNVKVGANRAAAGSRFRIGVSPHAPYTVRPELMTSISAWTNDHNLPISIHVAESMAESALIERGEGPFAEMFKARGIDWRTPGVSPTKYVNDFGILRPGSLAIHCVQQNSEDIAILAGTGAAVVHCPKSNGKLGAGIAPLASWLTNPAILVALGTDSAVSNNAHDMFEEMRFALLNQRALTRNPVAVTAEEILKLATWNGAKALGLGDVCGTLTPGKRADMIAVDLSGAHCIPATDPYSALVYSARASDVIATWIDGDIVYEREISPSDDQRAICETAAAIRGRLTATPDSAV